MPVNRVLSGVAVAAAAIWLAGCGGGGQAQPTTPSSASATTGQQRSRQADDGMVTSGVLGTLPQIAIESTLQARQRKFLRCFAQTWGHDDLVGGDFRLAFRVGVDGSVRWVYLVDSTVGDRDTERCLLSVAQAAKFPRPMGGEAEFTWSMGVDPSSDVRPPVEVPADAVAAVVSDQASAVLQQCGQGSGSDYRVTAYVDPGGAVRAVGVAAPVQAEAIGGAAQPAATAPDALDCVAAQVRTWQLPDPGSYPGKVTFSLR